MNLLSRLLKKTSAIIDLLSEYLFLAGGIIIVGVMLLITVATISRYFFGQAMAWTSEIAAYCLLLITFFGGPLLARTDSHINVDILPNLLNEKHENILHFISALVSSVVCALISYFAITTTIEAYVDKIMIVSFINTPKYILLAIIALGFVLMALGFLKTTFEYWILFKKNRYKELI